MKYLVIEATTVEELQEKVQQQLNNGWIPLGGLSVATYGAMSWWYYQAIVKHTGS